MARIVHLYPSIHKYVHVYMHVCVYSGLLASTHQSLHDISYHGTIYSKILFFFKVKLRERVKSVCVCVLVETSPDWLYKDSVK